MTRVRSLRRWLLALGLTACSASHGEQGNTSGSNWLRCTAVEECTAPEAVRCSQDGYCLDGEGKRIPEVRGTDPSGDGVDPGARSDAQAEAGGAVTPDAGTAAGADASADAQADGGMSMQSYALCDGTSAVRLAMAVEGGQVEPTYDFTNPYGHTFLFVLGTCHYYASSAWLQGTVEGDLSASQAAQIEQRLSLAELNSKIMYHDLESCPDAGPVWVRTASGYADCVCGCDSRAPALVGAVVAQAGTLRDELIAAGTAASGDVELFAVDWMDSGGPQPNDLSWPFAWSVSEVSVTQEELFQDRSVPKRRTLRDAEARSARMLRSMALARDPFSSRIRVVQSGKGYQIYVRDVLPAAVQQAIKQVRDAQAAVWRGM
jgi:hypothetical protein